MFDAKITIEDIDLNIVEKSRKEFLPWKASAGNKMNHLTGGFLDGRDRTLFIVTHLVGRCACLSDEHVCIDPSGVFPCYVDDSIEACELGLLCQTKTHHTQPFIWGPWFWCIRKNPEPKQDESGFQKTRYCWSYALMPA